MWPSRSKSKIDRNRNGEVGEAIAQIPDEGMATNNHVGGRNLFEATHGIQPLLEVSIVTLDAIVEVL